MGSTATPSNGECPAGSSPSTLHAHSTLLTDNPPRRSNRSVRSARSSEPEGRLSNYGYISEETTGAAGYISTPRETLCSSEALVTPRVPPAEPPPPRPVEELPTSSFDRALDGLLKALTCELRLLHTAEVTGLQAEVAKLQRGPTDTADGSGDGSSSARVSGGAERKVTVAPGTKLPSPPKQIRAGGGPRHALQGVDQPLSARRNHEEVLDIILDGTHWSSTTGTTSSSPHPSALTRRNLEFRTQLPQDGRQDGQLFEKSHCWAITSSGEDYSCATESAALHEALQTAAISGHTAHDVRRANWGGGKTSSMTSTFLSSSTGWDYTLHPQSRTKLSWDFCSLLLIAYDVLMLPLQPFDLPDLPFEYYMEWLGACYWTLDIGVNFCTAIYESSDGKLTNDPWKIAPRYLRTWFGFDFILAIAAWGNTLVRESNISGIAALFRVFRILRFGRLLRLFKVMNLMSQFQGSVNSDLFVLTVGLQVRVVLLICLTHYIACGWYWVGCGDHGWVKELGKEEKGYIYLTSLHWSVSQFTGTMEVNPLNSMERLYGIVVLFLALIISSVFISDITNMMAQLSAFYQERATLLQTLRAFKVQNPGISRDIVSMLKASLTKGTQEGRDQQLLQRLFEFLPVRLVAEVDIAVRRPVLVTYHILEVLDRHDPPFVDALCTKAVQDVAHNMVCRGENIFSKGDIGNDMYFLKQGTAAYVEYVKSEDGVVEERLTPLQKGGWICEAVLWAQWHHTGDFYATRVDSHIFGLNSKKFEMVLRHFPQIHGGLMPYAHNFVHNMNQYNCSDLGLEHTRRQTSSLAAQTSSIGGSGSDGSSRGVVRSGSFVRNFSIPSSSSLRNLSTSLSSGVGFRNLRRISE